MVSDPLWVGKDSGLRYKYFVKQYGLKDSQCVLMATHKPDNQPTQDWTVPPGDTIHTHIVTDECSLLL